MSRLGRALVVAAAVVVLVATGACGAQEAAPGSTQAQADLPAPVIAVAHEPSAPEQLVIDGRSAPTQAVATDAQGTLLPPTDISKLGWWVDSALPGSGAGTIVVVGHVDDVAQGTGYAARFTTLTSGSTATIETADGQHLTYRVSRVVDAQKKATGTDAVPFDELNRLDGPETLALVTCGGPFIGPPLGYRDNIIVFAEPA
ncbi:class F sortase [Gordonia liuliyuniae]|uniref:Class F sortase n=1 Tax=Gordonia liuliyuniae TaxID=2911517 RepID=A0ABS9IQV2_9ACTN|nr:class F sortase [Gordonia liuliyuniae]MCF8587946.1 class F sortase [Gordonia liuliyuniae]